MWERLATAMGIWIFCI